MNGDAIILYEKISLTKNSKKFIASVINTTFTKKYSYAEKCSADKKFKRPIVAL